MHNALKNKKIAINKVVDLIKCPLPLNSTKILYCNCFKIKLMTLTSKCDMQYFYFLIFPVSEDANVFFSFLYFLFLKHNA